MRPVRVGGRVVASVLALALVGGCTGDGDETDEPTPSGDAVEPAPVDLGVEGVDGAVRVGVLVSSGAVGAEGGDVLARAQGAVVAQQRLGGDDAVELVVRDDRGESEAAVRAVDELVADGVAGIVVGSTGPHLDAALARAAEAGVATVLPYAPAPAGSSTTWSTAPAPAAVGARIASGLAELSYDAPVAVLVDGATLEGVDAVATVSTTSDALGQALTGVEQALGSGADSVVVAGPAAAQGQLVAGVQTLAQGDGEGGSGAVAVALTPQAQDPAFTTSLAAASGVLESSFLTAGPDAGDATTLEAGVAGNSAAAFFAALRSAAGDPEVLDLLGGSFSAVAAAADIVSHDAVVALVRAAEAAGSTEPADVAVALAGLTPGPADGLAGPSLDFSRAQALPDDAVEVLVATTDDPGVRPATTADTAPAALFWFAAGGG